MAQLFKNNAWSATDGAISDVATTIVIAAGTGAKFPAPTGGDYFLLTLSDTTTGSETAWEIVQVTARSTDTLTVVRGQEGTTARSWSNGTPCDMRVTAGGLDARVDEHEAASDPHPNYALESSLGTAATATVGHTTGNVVPAGGANGALTIGTNDATSLTLETNNTARVTVDSAGNVGIGTSSPSQRLEISGAAESGSLAAQITNTDDTGFSTLWLNELGGIARNGSAQGSYAGANSLNLLTIGAHPIGIVTNNIERLRIDASGNVGIGTAAPAKRLEVRGVGGNAAIRLQETGSFGVAWDIDVGSSNGMRFNNNAGSPLSYSFLNGNVGIGTSSPAVKLEIKGSGSDSRMQIISTSSNFAGSIYKSTNEWFVGENTLDNGGAFSISSNIASVFTERLRITASGNVGIGTSSPTGKLDVYGNTNAYALRVTDGTRTGGLIPSTAGSIVLYTPDSTALDFWTNDSPRMRIDASGNVLVTGSGGLGYGVGSGGTVSQATSKSTAVTLNKPCGLITTHNQTLNANTTAQFIVNNSLVAAGDVVVVNTNTTGLQYQVQVFYVQAGRFDIALTNISGSNLTSNVQIRFAVIKGSAS